MPISRPRDFSADLEAFKTAATATGTFFPQEDEDIAKEEKVLSDLKSRRSRAWAWGSWAAWVAFLFLVVDDAANRMALLVLSGSIGLWWRLRTHSKLATALVDVHREVSKTHRQLHAYRFGDTVFSRIGTQVGSSDDLALLRHWVLEHWQIRDLEKFREACLATEYPDETEAMVGHIPWESEVADQMRERGTYDRAVLESWRMACAMRGDEVPGQLANPR